MKVKCPYFLNRTNGKKLFINCSSKKYIDKNSLRKEFDTKEERTLRWLNHCCDDYKSCKNYEALKEGE